MTQPDTIGERGDKPYALLNRKVKALRAKVADYDRETADLKRAAERSGGSVARSQVERTRSKGFAELREKLHAAEAQLSAWQFPRRQRVSEQQSFSAAMRGVLSMERLPNPPGPHSGASGVGQGDAS